MDPAAPAAPAVPPGWEAEYSSEHRRYYYINLATGESTWERPQPAQPAAAAAAAAAPPPPPPAYKPLQVAPAPAPAAGPAPGRAPAAGPGGAATGANTGSNMFAHIDPQGRQNPYPAEVSSLIAAARQSGQPACRVPDVVLPNGRTLQFEVRFGSAAVSPKFRWPPASGMLQVNLATDDSRVVVPLQQPQQGRRGRTPKQVGGGAAGAGAGGGDKGRGMGAGGGPAPMSQSTGPSASWEIEGQDGTWEALSPADCAAVRQRSSLLKAVITAFPSVSLPFLAVPLRSHRTVAISSRRRPVPGSSSCSCRPAPGPRQTWRRSSTTGPPPPTFT
eukprot:SAG22_NODE_138_length_18031_cov_5.796621_18_plen_331_part_00